MGDHLERIGQVMGDYRLLRWLGGGGFGNVYLAEHTHDGEQVALKVLEIRLTRSEDFRAFLNEASAMRLRHPHILPLLNFGLSQEDTPFLVMEYAPLGTLRDRHPKGSHVPLSSVVDYARQVASALQYAHTRRVVHRDVKPENMLVRTDGMILLSDFGIATTAHSTHSLSANQGIGGTIPYMAPEQLDGQPRIGSDQYALGIVIYEWLAGRCPFQGTAVEVAMQHTMKQPPSLIQQVPGLPREVEEVVFQALAKSPKDRFASMQTFLQALQDASHDHPALGKLPDEPFSKQALPVVSPSATLKPLKADASGIPSSLEVLESTVIPLSQRQPITQIANQNPELTTKETKTLPITESVRQPLLTTLPTHGSVSAKGQGTLLHNLRFLRSPKKLSVRTSAILIGAVLLILAGSLGIFMSITTSQLDAAARATAQAQNATRATATATSGLGTLVAVSATANAQATATVVVVNAQATAYALAHPPYLSENKTRLLAQLDTGTSDCGNTYAGNVWVESGHYGWQCILKLTNIGYGDLSYFWSPYPNTTYADGPPSIPSFCGCSSDFPYQVFDDSENDRLKSLTGGTISSQGTHLIALEFFRDRVACPTQIDIYFVSQTNTIKVTWICQ